MLRNLTIKDETEVNNFLSVRRPTKLYLEDAVRSYGYDDKNIFYIGEFDKEGKIKAILLNFKDMCSLYANDSYDARSFYYAMKAYGYNRLTGMKDEIVSLLCEDLSLHFDACESYMVLYNFKNPERVANCKIEDVNLEDLDEVFEMINSTEEYPRYRETLIEHIKWCYHTKRSSGVCIRDSETNSIIGYIEKAVEVGKYAMLGRLIVRPEYRRRGYAKELIRYMTQQVVDRGKFPVLYHSTQFLMKFYVSIGYQNLGDYLLYFDEKRTEK